MRFAPARALAAVVLMGASAGQTLFAQDLLQIWEAALQRDPEYAAAQAGRNADQEIIPQARAGLLPYITAEAAGEAQEVRHLSGLKHHDTRGVGLWNLTLTQPIIDIQRWDQLEQSRYMAASSDLALQEAYQNLILRVTQAYFDVLAAQDTVRTLQAQKQAIASQLHAAQQGFELGSNTVADIYEARARLDLLNANELQAQNALQVSEDLLAKIINERPQTLAGLDSNKVLPQPSPNRISDWTAQAATANLAAARARLTTLIVDKQIDISKGGHYPRLNLYAQTGTASNRGILGQDNGPRSLDSAIGLQLSIPIFSGGGVSSEVREQTSRLQQARYQFEAAKRQAVQATQQYFSGVVSGLAQIDALRAAEKSSLASLNANKTGYEVGVRVNIDVLNAQQQLYETQRALSRARYDTLMNSLRLKASSGILAEADILAINQLLNHRETPIRP